MVRIPDLAKAKGRLDFGKAFYVTSYKRQAEKWARRKAMHMLSTPVVSTYQLADDFTGYRVLDFKETYAKNELDADKDIAIVSW